MHVAARAHALHGKLLDTVEQQHVDVFGHLGVALQLYRLHFGHRQIAEPRVVLLLFAFELRELLACRDQHRMLLAKALVERSDLQLQRRNLLFVLHTTFQIDLRFVARVD